MSGRLQHVANHQYIDFKSLLVVGLYAFLFAASSSAEEQTSAPDMPHEINLEGQPQFPSPPPLPGSSPSPKSGNLESKGAAKAPKKKPLKGGPKGAGTPSAKAQAPMRPTGSNLKSSPTEAQTLPAKSPSTGDGVISKEAHFDEPNLENDSNSAVGAEDSTQWESFRDGGLTRSMEEVTKGVKIEDIVEPPSEYHYAAFGKPDPFKPVTRPPRKGVTEATVDPIEVPILSTLQLVNLNQVEILGIWQGSDGKRKAMVTTKDTANNSQAYVVKVGDPIGNRGGVIQSIVPSSIVVREFEVLSDGTRKYTDITIPFWLSVKAPTPALGSWIFKPGVPQPDLRKPDQTNLILPPVGGSRPPLVPNLTPGIPNSMLAPQAQNGANPTVQAMEAQMRQMMQINSASPPLTGSGSGSPQAPSQNSASMPSPPLTGPNTQPPGAQPASPGTAPNPPGPANITQPSMSDPIIAY